MDFNIQTGSGSFLISKTGSNQNTRIRIHNPAFPPTDLVKKYAITLESLSTFPPDATAYPPVEARILMSGT